jgi:hypothetical protein
MIKVVDDYKPVRLHEWEEVEDGVERLKVPGGWIYRFLYVDSVAVAFVPYWKED